MAGLEGVNVTMVAGLEGVNVTMMAGLMYAMRQWWPE